MKNLKKILLVGSFSQDPSIYTYAHSFQRALQGLEFDVQTFNTHTKPSRLNWLKNFSLNHLNARLLKTVRKTKPDLVFLLKAQHITPQALEKIKTFGCRLTNFYPDNPFTLWNGNSTPHVLNSFRLYDCFMSWSPILEPALQSAGCAHTCFFPFSYDHTIFESALAFKPDDYKPFASDVCFVGTWEPERQQWLASLIEKLPYINLAIWGNEWKENCHNPQLKKALRGPAIYQHDMIKAFRATKIVLNFIRQQNKSAHNMRTFEAPASGAFLLTERSHQQATEFFVGGESIECFGSHEELADKVELYLNNPFKRKAIAQAGMQIAQDFTLTKQLHRYLSTCPALKQQG